MTNSPDQPASPPVRRPSRRARHLLVAGAVAGALVLVAHLPVVQRWLTPVLHHALSAAAGGVVTTDSLEFSLFTGRVHATGLRLVRPGLEFTGTSLDAYLRPWRGLVVRAAAPRLVVSLTPDGTSGARDQRPWAALDRVAVLDVSGGTVRVQSEDGSQALLIEGLDVSATRDGVLLAGTVVARAVSFPQREFEWSDARITFDVPGTTGTLHVRSAEATVGQSRVRLSGELEQLNPLIGSAHVDVPAAMSLIRTLAPAAPVEGDIGARAEILVDRSGQRATVVADATAVRLAGVGPFDGRISGHLEGAVLRVDDIDLAAYGGRIRGEGAASLDGKTSELRVGARGVDLTRVLASHAPTARRVASHADADLSVRMERWDWRSLGADGTITFRRGTGPGVPVLGTTSISADHRRVRVATSALRVHDVDLRVQGTLGFDGRLDLRYGVRLADISRLPAVLAAAGVAVPRAGVPRLDMRGALSADGAVSGMPGRWVARASVAGPRLSIGDRDLDVSSELRVTPTSVRLVSFSAAGPDGAVSASGDIPTRRTDAWRVAGSFDRLRPGDWLARQGVSLDASLQGRFEVTGLRADPEVAVTLDGDLSSRAAASAAIPATPTVAVEASARASRNGVVVDRFRARSSAGAVEGNGRWSPESGALEARVRSSSFPLSALPGVPAVPGLESVLTGEIEIAGTLPALTGRGSVSATGTVWQGTALPDLRLDLVSDGRAIALDGSIAQRPWLTGQIPLATPWPLHLDVDLTPLPLNALLRAFPALEKRDASMALSGRALVDVDLASPSRVRYEAHVETAEGRFTQAWKTGPFSVRGTLDDLSVEGLEVQFDLARLHVDGRIGLARDTSDRLTISGAAPLSHLALATPIEEADGEALLDVTLTGRLARPSWAGTVRVANGLVRQGALRVDGIELVASLDDRGVAISRASARVAGGHVYGTGTLAMRPAPSDRHRLELHARGIDVARLMPAREGDPDITAVVDADVRADFDRASLDAVRADGSLNSLVVSAGGRTLGLEAPVTLSVRAGTLTHTALRLTGSAGHVTLESTADLAGGSPQLAIGVDGEIDLVAVQPMMGHSGSLTGFARVAGRVERDQAGWHARGEGRLSIGRLVLTDPAIVVSDVSVGLRGAGERIEVVDGSARVGDGTIEILRGHLLLPSAGGDVDLALRVDRVPLEYPLGLRTQSSGDLRLTGRSGAYRLGGDVVVHRAVFEQEDARGTAGIDMVSASLTALTGRGSLRDRIALDVRLRLDDGLRVVTPLASLVVDGVLGVGGSLLAPDLDGSFTLRQGGTIRVSRALVRLDAGRVELSGYPARQPEVEVRGTTQVSGIGIDVSLSGPLDDVRMTLSSRTRSDLGQGDLAALILTGRTTSGVAADGVAIVAEELASSLGRVLNRQLGGFVMFDVSSDESLIPENTNSPLRMNVGIPLSDWLYVIYSQSLETGARRWVVDFRPGGDFRLRVISDDNGSEAVEASHRFGFDAWSRRLRPPARRVRSRIGSVTVTGASPGEEADVRARMRLEPGDEFDFFRSQDGARAAQAWFVARGFLEATVDARQETTTDGRIALTVHVVRGPLVHIEWRGEDPGRPLRRHVASGWSSILPREERAARLAREVRRTLQGDRFFAATVTPTVTYRTAGEGQDPDEVRVTFDVARGPRGAGVELRFDGNASVRDDTLAASLPPRNSAAFFALLEPEGARRLAAALRVAHATEGFLDMRIGAPTTSFAGAGARMIVTIPIVEGDRAKVVALELPEEVRAAGTRSPVLTLSDGAPFRLDAYGADRARLLAWLREQGHPDARVTSAIEPRPGGLVVRFSADAGPRVTMGDVRTARAGRTRPSIIENAVATPPGEVIRASRLDEARQQLTDTRVFRSVDLRLAPVEDRENVRDVVVDVVERHDIGLEYSIRYTTAGQALVGGVPTDTRAGVQLGAGLEIVNPFGGADRYRALGLVGTARQLLNVRYDRSMFFGWHLPTEVLLYDDRARLPDSQGLEQRVLGATFEQTRSLRRAPDGGRRQDRLRMKWGYTIREIDYAGETGPGSRLNGRRASLIHSLSGDTRDSLTDPRHGLTWALGSEVALEGLGSDVNYYRAFGQFSIVVPLLPRLTWAQGYRVGVVPGDDPLLLLDSRFFAGGASSVRGFSEQSLGPRTPEGEALGGQATLIFNQELRFPLWKRLHGGVFYDAGNAFALARDLDVHDLRQSAGVGLRLMFPFGPVRLDWAHVIGPRAGEKPSRVVFSIGHAF